MLNIRESESSLLDQRINPPLFTLCFFIGFLSYYKEYQKISKKTKASFVASLCSKIWDFMNNITSHIFFIWILSSYEYANS